MVELLHVNPEWLISGNGPIFKDVKEVTFEKKMRALKRTTDAFQIDEQVEMSNADRQIIETAQLCSVTDWANKESRDRAIAQLIALRGSATEYQMVPCGSARPSARHGTLIQSDQIVDYMAFRRDWLQRVLGVTHSDIMLMEVRGRCMSGTLDNGDLALVDLRQNKLDVSDVFVFEVDGSLLVKRVQRKLDGTVVITSDNKAYDPEVLMGDKLNELKVVGRVIWPRLR